MNWHLFLIVGIIVGTLLVWFSHIMFYKILFDVNGKSAAGQRIGIWWVQTGSTSVLDRHRQLFPQSRKRTQMPSLVIGGLALYSLTILLYATHHFMQGSTK